MQTRSSPIWDVTQRRLLLTDVSGRSINPIFKEQAVQEEWTAWHLTMGPIDFPETSVTTNLRCVTSQSGEDLIYTAAEAWNQKYYCS
jgi:hypothetical protein